MKILYKIWALGIGALLLGGALADLPLVNFDIHPQPLDRALTTFGQQSGLQIAFYPATIADGMISPDVRGTLAPQTALEQLLANTDLKYEFVNERTIRITRKSVTTSDLRQLSPRVAEISAGDIPQDSRRSNIRLAQSSESSSGGEKDDGENRNATAVGRAGIPEILVKDSRILNMDIRRTRDDSQPYVVFDRTTIERSGAINLEDFFRQRLPMNMQATFANQGVTIDGNRSSINLRGLGAAQTLILIDGHRTADVALRGAPNQHDINGIPLSAIERIEVLPTTASAVYGGSATGGVVNLILRRDYSGVDTKLAYDDAFGAAARKRIDIGSGFTLENGKTSILFTGSYEDADALTRGDRKFTADYLAESYAVGPAQLLPPNAPPLGATTNICAGSFSCTGAPLTLKPIYGSTALASSITSVPVGYVGPSSDNGAGLVARAGQFNLAQANSAQDNGLRSSLLAATEVKSLNATINRDFSRRVRAFVDAGLSENRSKAPYGGASLFSLAATAAGNPFQQPITVLVPNSSGDAATNTILSDRRVVGGVIVELPKAWRGEVDYTWNRTKYRSTSVPSLSAAGTTAVANGTLNIFGDTNLNPLDYSPYLVDNRDLPQEAQLDDVTLRLAGPIGSLPAGAPQLAFLLETRKGVQEESASYFGVSNFTSFYPDRSQSVDSAYAEVRLPIFSSKNRLPAVEELELQVSGRHDRYATRGATSSVSWIGTPESPPATFPTVTRATNNVESTDATVSMRWKPIADIALRASFGTGFLPPSVNQLATQTTTNVLGFLQLRDPLRGNNLLTSGDRLSGGNPNLQPEESESFSAGFILTPRFVPNFRWSVDYIKINKTDNIASFPGGDQAIINANASGEYPNRIVRAAPSSTDIANGWAGPITLLDTSSFNIARAKVEAFDTQMDYRFDTEFGAFDFFVLGTYQPHYKTQTALSQPTLEQVGFRNGALKYKANAGVNWNRGAWTLGWNTRYFDSYLVYPAGTTEPLLTLLYLNTHGQNLTIPSQIYHDVNAAYRFDEHLGGSGNWMSSVLSGAEIQLGIRNVFDKEPPRVQQTYSAYADPRLASYWISISARFGRE